MQWPEVGDPSRDSGKQAFGREEPVPSRILSWRHPSARSVIRFRYTLTLKATQELQ